MFSTMMIDPLAILPMPMARPPMDMTVSLTPKRSIRTRAIRIENGMVSEAMSELRRFHMKKHHDQDDEDDALEDGDLDVLDGLDDQDGLVVEGLDPDARGQVAGDPGQGAS